MGVQGLWQLLESTGKPVTLESLQGKILAIDISMWLHQSMKGMRDQQGNAVHNAHLQVLFNRICKLLFYKIKPVFVFDGEVPVLKRQTLAGRRQIRSQANLNKETMAKKLLTSVLKHHAVSTVLGNNTSEKEICMPAVQRQKDLFELNPLPEPDMPEETYMDDSWEERISRRHEILGEYQNLEDLDVEADAFKNLPADVRLEILSDLKESRKKTTYANIEALPSKGKDFSSYQIAKLMKQSKLSQKIQNTRKELNSENAGDITTSLIDGKLASEVISSRIVSDDSAYYILVKGLSKIPDTVVDTLIDQNNTDVKIEADFPTIDIVSEESLPEENMKNTEHDISNSTKDYLIAKTDEIKASELIFPSGKSSEITHTDNTKFPPTSDYSSEGGFIIEDESNDVKLIPAKRKLESEDNSSCIMPAKKFKDDNVANSISSNNILQQDLSRTANFHESNVTTNINIIENEEDETIIQVVKSPESDHHLGLVENQIKNDKLENATCISQEKIIEQSVEIYQYKTNGSEIEDSDTNSDEFIEVTINPSKIDADSLFPSSIFDSSSKQVVPIEPSLTEKENNIIQVSDAEDNILSETGHFENEFKGLTKSELVDIQETLEEEASDLIKQKGKQERLATSITDQMHKEAQELLLLFGVPYIIAPMEAEAQCAYLDFTNQTNGSITDDSDVFLFGGQNVYRHFFNKNKQVEQYINNEIEKILLLDRSKLINIGYLCGCDYTNGVKGIGPVTAMEILLEFPGNGIEGLQSLKKWKESESKNIKMSTTTKLKQKLRSLELNESFPNEAVYEAFINPVVDESMDKFQWGSPDLDLLRDFALDKLNWTKNKVDEMLLPVLKKLNANDSQTQIIHFYTKEVVSQSPVKSKRVNRIINRMKDVNNTDEIQNGKTSKGKTSKGKTSKGKTSQKFPGKKSQNKSVKITDQSGGWITQSKSAVIVNLSESGSDSDN